MLVALLAGGCYATVAAVRERRYWRQGFVAAWLVAPVVLTFAVSLVRPMFLAPYLIICVPALVLFGTAAIARLRRPVLVGLFVVPLVWLSATQVFVFYGRERGENWRDLARYVLASARPGDAVVFYPYYAGVPFEYYRRQSGVAGPVDLKGQSLAGRQRIWLVIRESDAAANSSEFRQLQASLAERYSVVDRRGFHRVGVRLYVSRPPPASSSRNFGFRHPPQMQFTEHDNLIDALARKIAGGIHHRQPARWRFFPRPGFARVGLHVPPGTQRGFCALT